MDEEHIVPLSCLCCSPNSSAWMPALLSSSKSTGLSATAWGSGCWRRPGGGATATRPSTLSCWSLGWSRDRPRPPGPSAAPTPGPAPAPTTASGESMCFCVMDGFLRAGDKSRGKRRTQSVESKPKLVDALCNQDIPVQQFIERVTLTKLHIIYFSHLTVLNARHASITAGFAHVFCT